MMSSGTVASSVEVVLARAGEGGVGEFFEQRVGLAVDDAVALLDRRAADRLGEMALAGAGRAEEEHVLALGDEARGGELVDERAIHLLVEIEVEGVERAVGVAEARQLVAALEQPVLSALEFVGDERGDEIDGRHLFGLRLAQAGFEDGGHAGEPQLPEGAIEFDEIHCGSPGRAIDEIAVEGELTDERIDLAQRERHGGRRSR